jgi:hypothetical protein
MGRLDICYTNNRPIILLHTRTTYLCMIPGEISRCSYGYLLPRVNSAFLDAYRLITPFRHFGHSSRGGRTDLIPHRMHLMKLLPVT